MLMLQWYWFDSSLLIYSAIDSYNTIIAKLDNTFKKKTTTRTNLLIFQFF